MRWNFLPLSAMQASTLFVILLATLYRVSLVTFKMQSWILCFSTLGECGLFLYTFSVKYPHDKSLEVRDPETAEACEKDLSVD
jgi:hypothetical protein